VSYVLTSESQAWLRSTQAGVELPPEVQQACERLEKADREMEPLGADLPVSKASELVTGGMPLAKAQAEAAKSAAKAADRVELREIAKAGRDGARFVLNRVVGAHRDELVLGIRPLVTDLIDQGRPHAEVLAEFAPNYAAADLLHRGTPDHMVAYQEAVELERRFGLLMAAWRASFRAESARSRGRVDVREVAQARWFWANPEFVMNDRLNGTHLNKHGIPTAIEPTVLGCASEPAEAGFRLATLGELAVIFAEEHGGAPRTKAEAKRLGVAGF
jgi:hypothetical protein